MCKSKCALSSTSDAEHIPVPTVKFGTETKTSAWATAWRPSPALDNNTVDMDRERANFVDNAVRYEATLRFINGSSKHHAVRPSLVSKTQFFKSKESRMSMFSIFSVSGSALSAQSQRLNVVASNLANVDAVAGPDGEKAYKARQVVFQTAPMGDEGAAGVKVVGHQRESTPLGRKVYSPEHPLADEQGYVTHSNVSAVDEMVDMISASRSYQNNVEVMNTAKSLLLKTLQLGQ